MKDCCGDPDSMRGSLGGIVEVPGGSRDEVVDSRTGEGLLAFDEVRVFVGGNAGAGDEGLQNVTGGSSPCDDNCSNLDIVNDHGLFIKEIKEMQEGYGDFVEVEKESNNLVLNRRTSVEKPQAVEGEDLGVAHVGLQTISQTEFSCSQMSYTNDTSVDCKNGVAVLIDDMKEIDKSYNKSVLAEKENEHLHVVLEKEPFVKTPDMIEDAGVGAKNSLTVTCSLCDDNGTSNVGEWKESKIRSEIYIGAAEKNCHSCLDDKMLIKGAEMADQEHNSKPPGLSTLLTLGDVSESSGTHIALKVGNATQSSSEDKGCKACNRCETVPLISSVSAADCHLISIDGKTVKQVESCSSVPEKSTGSMHSGAALAGGKSEGELLSGVEGIECNICKDKMLYSDYDNSEKDEPVNSQNFQGLTSTSIRVEGDEVCNHLEENSVLSEQAVVPAGCISRGLSGGSLEEVASCFSGEGLSFQQSSSSFTVVLAHPSDPVTATDCERKVTGVVNAASTCCSNVKDSCGQVSDGGLVNSKPAPLFVFRRTNPKRAASLRNNQVDVKPNHLTGKRNRARKCKKAADVSMSISSITLGKNNMRRKRSCFNRMTRKSVWGKIDSLLSVFTENISIVDLAQIQSKYLKRFKCCRSKGKKRMAHGDRNLRFPETQPAFSTHPMQLNGTIYLQPKFPDALNSQCSTESGNDALQNLSSPTVLHIPSRHGGGDCDPSADVVAPGQKFLQRDGQQGEKDIESTLTQDISCENMLEECPGVSSQDGSQPLVIDNRNLLNPESSPDSDIYNPVLDANTTTEPGAFTIQNAGVNNNRIVPERTVLHGIDVEALNTSEAIVNLEFASALDVQLQTGNKKDKKEKDVQTSQKEYILSEQDLIDKKLHNLDQTTATEPLKYVRQRRNGIKERHLTSSDSNKKVSRKGSRRAFTGESNILGMTELDCSEEPRKVELGLETWAMPEQEIRNIQPEEGGSVISNKTKGLRLSRSSKTKVGREKSNLTDPSRRQRRKSFGQKNSNIQKTEKQRNKKKNQTLDGCHEALGSMKLSPVRVCNELDKPKDGTYGLDGQSVRQRKAWVLCDDCHQWRCIPTALADMIDQSDCRWTCKENPDKAFADCSLPQEKTNSEINAELEISDASCDEDAPKPNFARPMKSKISASQPAPWTHIKSNLYLHRNRKSQTIDETMVCHCKPSSEASLGCGDQCLNRMLNIECVKGTCPCGELCSNQQFQKRKYSRLKWIPCGKKGFGLQLLEDVSSGQFLIEYVGEVLDFPTYESRQRYYASRGQKHFYFMTLNGGEVIDACAKGNLGRFINHSCDPNCRTEKWMVNGEVCIGLFAIRDIKKGEEVTFNYNYVRVFGAAAKKCVCGSSICQGYIGGDPLNTEVIVQDDSDDEYLERFMVHEDNEKAVDMDVTLSDANNMIVKDADVSMDKKELLKDCSPISETEDDHQFKDTLCASSSDDISFSSMGNLQVRDAISRPLPEIQLLEESSKRLDNRQNKEITSPPSAYAQQLDIPSQASRAATVPISDSAVNISASGPIDEQLTRSKSFFARSSNSSHTIKKSKQSTKPMVPQKAKKLPVQSGNAQFERVEKELNELLDADGGISKRKDATRGYLKLLFVTAAEGDNVGAASQSIRDLSLILDALLKTKSRTVLVDIINKNGLQMLHNIMKQNRSKFTRIPILRKLLKVLEFLALKGILTPEHINKGPPCSGMESFKESMLSLTRHNDNQVHQIARNFRDKWIPRGIKRVEPTDRDKMQLDTQRSYNSWFKSSLFNRRIDQGARDSDAIVCVSEPMEQLTSSSLVMPGEASAHSSQQVCSLPLTDNNPTTGTRTRKRKSRWDQPSDYKIPDQQNLWSSQQEVASEAGSNIVKTGFSDLEYCSSTKVLKKSLDCSIEEDCPMDGVAGLKKFLQQNTDDEVPPGFGLQQKDHLVTPETLISRSEVVVGYLQERYLSHLSVSYGIPVSLVQKLGTPDCNTEAHQCWTVAPSMPFHPFPPLPPYPRGQSKLSNLGTESSRKSVITQGSSEIQPCNLDSRATDAAPVPSTSVERPVDSSEAWPRNPHNTQRMSWSSNSGGRRFFQPERGGNSQRFRRRWAPWPQEGSDGHRGSVRYRDSGRSSRGERKYWPPWPQEDSC